MFELTIVAFLFATTIVICIPMITNDTQEAKIVSSWKKNFAELQSNFEVFNVTDKDNIEKICELNEKNKDEKIQYTFH